MLRTPAQCSPTGNLDSPSPSGKDPLSPSLYELEARPRAEQDLANGTSVQKLSSAFIAEYTRGSVETIGHWQQGGTGDPEAIPQLLEGLFSMCLADAHDGERAGTPPAEQTRAAANSNSERMLAELNKPKDTGRVTTAAEQPVDALTYKSFILRVIRSIHPKDFGDILEALEGMLPESMRELVEPLYEVVDEAAEDVAAAQAARQAAPEPGGSLDPDEGQGPEDSEASGDEDEVEDPERSSPTAANAREARIRVHGSPQSGCSASPIDVPAAPLTAEDSESPGIRSAATPAGGPCAGRDPSSTPPGCCRSSLLLRFFGAFVLAAGLATLGLVGVLATSSDCGCTCLANATYSG